METNLKPFMDKSTYKIIYASDTCISRILCIAHLLGILDVDSRVLFHLTRVVTYMLGTINTISILNFTNYNKHPEYKNHIDKISNFIKRARDQLIDCFNKLPEDTKQDIELHHLFKISFNKMRSVAYVLDMIEFALRDDVYISNIQ